MSDPYFSSDGSSRRVEVEVIGRGGNVNDIFACINRGMEKSRMDFPFIGLSYIDSVKKFVRTPSPSLIFKAQRLVAVPESIHQPETKVTIIHVINIGVAVSRGC
jgi:hypothetical protein